VISIFRKHLDQVVISPLLGAFSEQEIENFLKTRQFKIVSYKKNSVIHFDGELCNKLEIILSGKIMIDRIEESGDFLTISEFSDGDILGGNLMFSSDPYYLMTITASTDSLILEIQKELLFRLLTENQKFLTAYLEFISDRAAVLGNKIKFTLKKSIRESVLNYLKQEYKMQNSYTIILTTSKKILAEKIGVQRTSLSRELSKMQNDGLITFDNKSITIKDKQILSI